MGRFATESAAARSGTHAEGIARARRRIAALLADGPTTERIPVLVAETDDGEIVGNVWEGSTQMPRGPHRARQAAASVTGRLTRNHVSPGLESTVMSPRCRVTTIR